jgi:hypothetical protein
LGQPQLSLGGKTKTFLAVSLFEAAVMVFVGAVE